MTEDQISLSSELTEDLDELAKEAGKTKAEVVETILDDALDDDDRIDSLFGEAEDEDGENSTRREKSWFDKLFD